ncbi:hypothetical protein CEXT_307211 [Caerostris extrusa]|uniref:Uncharacterized protein n=1 Tax=Caerostris extrusa TaxID=172846 RepID=A0AAV4TNN6_CAEEX|nr:hypothetical protein CEXT_307211 [Caerostris extrusa]
MIDLTQKEERDSCLPTLSAGEVVNYRQPPRMPIDMSEAHDDTTVDGSYINMPPLSDISLAGFEINVV